MDHLLSISNALEHPVVVGVLVAVALALLATPVLVAVMVRAKRISPEVRSDILTRWRTWLWLAPAAAGAIVISPLSAMLLAAALGLLCYREFARGTGVFRERTLSAIVVCGVALLLWACVDNWYGLFAALAPLVVATLAGVAALQDRPQGYLQRVALACMGFLLFGVGLMHLAYMANARDYRPALFIVVAGSQVSDIAAFIFGKALGRRHLFPNTSPRKTLAGHLGALLIVAPTTAFLAHWTYLGTALDTPLRLAGFGVALAIAAQVGDLVLGSIKRDLGVKDLSGTLPGHGGFTDRCNSLLLVAPVAFHYIGYFVGFGLERLPRVFSS